MSKNAKGTKDGKECVCGAPNCFEKAKSGHRWSDEDMMRLASLWKEKILFDRERYVHF